MSKVIKESYVEVKKVKHQKLSTAELLFNSAQSMGLCPEWITPQSVFAINVLGQERYINLARSPLNSDVSVALAKNKFVTRCILERYQMPNIPYALPKNQSEAKAFLSLHETIVAKPNQGSGAQDIHIINTVSQLQKLNIEKYILEKYISGKELRYLLLNGEVIGVHQSEYGISVDANRPLKRISYPRNKWDIDLLDMSLRIANILALKFAAVDYLIDSSGQSYILEVNTMPGLKWFHAPSYGPTVEVAPLFLKTIVDMLDTEKVPIYSQLLETHLERTANL